jgi:hypothetical protein
MAKYLVRNGYVVHFPGGKSLGPGEVFEPTPDILANQGWKLTPIVEGKPPEEVEQKSFKKPPRDRAMKSDRVYRKTGA